MQLHTHYDNLKVARNAPLEVIRAAYRVLAQRYHPDKNPSPEAQRIMKVINEAYAVLGDPKRRADHDAWIDEKLSKNQPDAPFPGVNRETSKPYAKTRPAPSQHTTSPSPGEYSTTRPWQESAAMLRPWRRREWLLLLGAAVLIGWLVTTSHAPSRANSSPPSTDGPSTAGLPPTSEHQSYDRPPHDVGVVNEMQPTGEHRSHDPPPGTSASKVEEQVDEVRESSHEARQSDPAPMADTSYEPVYGVSEEYRQATLCYVKDHAPDLIYGTMPSHCEGMSATFVQKVRESLNETSGLVPRLDECAAILFQPAHLTIVARVVWEYRNQFPTHVAYAFGIKMACEAALAEPVKLAK